LFVLAFGKLCCFFFTLLILWAVLSDFPIGKETRGATMHERAMEELTSCRIVFRTHAHGGVCQQPSLCALNSFPHATQQDIGNSKRSED
jgi:hypothetical protein